MRDGCIGYRVDVRRHSKTHCVLLKALRSRRPEDCDLVKLRRAMMLVPQGPPALQTLSLAEHERVMRKPYREATGFRSGDTLQLVGKRTQLSNVPTKLLFSHVKDPGEHSEKRAGGQADRSEAHLGFYIDWRRQRTWISTYADGEWGRERPVHSGSEGGTGRPFPFRLGEAYVLNVTRTSTSLVISSGEQLAAVIFIGSDSGVNQQAATRPVNQISVLGSAVERATVTFGEPQWRTMHGMMCANELVRAAFVPDNSGSNESNTAAFPASGPSLRASHKNWAECRASCMAARDTCTGFAFAEGALVPGAATSHGRGLCRLQGALKTKTISACQFRTAPNWDLNLRLQQAPARWYNVAMVSPVGGAVWPSHMGLAAGTGTVAATASPSGRRLAEEGSQARVGHSMQGLPLLNAGGRVVDPADDAFAGWVEPSVIGLPANWTRSMAGKAKRRRRHSKLAALPDTRQHVAPRVLPAPRLLQPPPIATIMNAAPRTSPLVATADAATDPLRRTTAAKQAAARRSMRGGAKVKGKRRKKSNRGIGTLEAAATSTSATPPPLLSPSPSPLSSPSPSPPPLPSPPRKKGHRKARVDRQPLRRRRHSLESLSLSAGVGRPPSPALPVARSLHAHQVEAVHAHTPAAARQSAPTSLGASWRFLESSRLEMPCVLRESSYNYCSNPAVLTREATNHMMESLYGAWWVGTCSRAPGMPTAPGMVGDDSAFPLSGSSSVSMHVRGLKRLALDGAFMKLGLVPELATEDLVLLRYRQRLLAVASLIEIKSWETSARRSNQPRRPFIFAVDDPAGGKALRCDNFQFNFWEKNWMPFEHDGRLLAVRWFSPHTVVEIFPDNGTCTQLTATPHAFAVGSELHGGTPPIRFDAERYLTLVRLRTGSWIRARETRNYVNQLYLFSARPPFAVERVSMPFTLPSCAQPRLHMLIQVAKSFVKVDGGYLLCWGELDCYSCCSHLSHALVAHLLNI